ncbi:AraC family ligand binding domain-containing protein [Basfia succiniciproducens]|uniref:Transcriptional regulator, AraC family n=1 Tax=Basfia succiniciproducens TaxID=653940 RepID=A0A1G5DL87_9PAST|nr:AraC family ligand binding domain-containing protein [Basfia succiniciproducens]SCY15404.1 transcriptional regulator, AraC family [Basfia succiniciproducens]
MIQKLLARDFFNNKEQPIILEPRAPQEIFPEHTHDFDELVIVKHGSGWHILNGYPHDLYPGVVLYIQAQDHHSYENLQDLCLTNILIQSNNNFKYLNNIDILLNGLKPENSSYQLINKKTAEYIDSLLEKINAIDESYNLQNECLFFQVLSSIQAHQFNDSGYGNTEEKGRQMIRWLENNFEKEIDWEELAEKFALPIRTLHRYIKSQTGHTPQNYVT